MAIPRIVHQIWLGSPVPDRYKHWSQSFTRVLPGWEHRTWNDEQSDRLVREKFPWLLDTYMSLESPVARCDLLRYMVIHEHGGLYADMDCECRIDLDFIREDDEFIICSEVDTTSERVMNMYPTDISPQYCQWAFLARPRHPALLQVLEHIDRNIGADHGDHPILSFVKRTGPHAFTAGINRYMEQGGSIKLIPSSYFGCFDTRNTFRFVVSTLFPERFRKVYIRHHFAGSWMDDAVKRRMMIRNALLMPESVAKPGRGQ